MLFTNIVDQVRIDAKRTIALIAVENVDKLISNINIHEIAVA